jgi:hypothetical protein
MFTKGAALRNSEAVLPELLKQSSIWSFLQVVRIKTSGIIRSFNRFMFSELPYDYK